MLIDGRDRQEKIEVLAAEARAICEGCRLAWRYSSGWRHREPIPMTCTAQEQRRELRRLSQKQETDASQ